MWFCYCLAERGLRKDFWKTLAICFQSGLDAWLCIGDFNDVLDQNEKYGGRRVSLKTNFFLRSFLNEVGGID